jgi:hypothetical protein
VQLNTENAKCRKQDEDEKQKEDYLEGLDDLVLPVPGHSLGIDDGRGDALLHTGREPSQEKRVFFKFGYLFEYISTHPTPPPPPPRRGGYIKKRI